MWYQTQFFRGKIIKLRPQDQNNCKIDIKYDIMRYKNTYFAQCVTLVWSWWTKYPFQGVSRPYRGCLDRFIWLFYHFIRFYDPKYPKICESRSWWSKSKYYVHDQSVTLVCTFRTKDHIRGGIAWFGFSLMMQNCIANDAEIGFFYDADFIAIM